MTDHRTAQTLRAIADLCAETGYSPTVREIAYRLGISLSSAHYRLTTLRERGVITWQKGAPRTIRVVDAGQRSDTL